MENEVLPFVFPVLPPQLLTQLWRGDYFNKGLLCFNKGMLCYTITNVCSMSCRTTPLRLFSHTTLSFAILSVPRTSPSLFHVHGLSFILGKSSHCFTWKTPTCHLDPRGSIFSHKNLPNVSGQAWGSCVHSPMFPQLPPRPLLYHSTHSNLIVGLHASHTKLWMSWGKRTMSLPLCSLRAHKSALDGKCLLNRHRNNIEICPIWVEFLGY